MYEQDVRTQGIPNSIYASARIKDLGAIVPGEDNNASSLNC